VGHSHRRGQVTRIWIVQVNRCSRYASCGTPISADVYARYWEALRAYDSRAEARHALRAMKLRLPRAYRLRVGKERFL